MVWLKALPLVGSAIAPSESQSSGSALLPVVQLCKTSARDQGAGLGGWIPVLTNENRRLFCEAAHTLYGAPALMRRSMSFTSAIASSAADRSRGTMMNSLPQVPDRIACWPAAALASVDIRRCHKTAGRHPASGIPRSPIDGAGDCLPCGGPRRRGRD